MKTNKKRFFVYFHTHWDREWYKTRVEFNFRLVKVFDDILKKLQSGELLCFYFDGQTSALKDYLKIRPENEDLIKDFIAQKKLFIGPFFCSTDSFLISAQSMLANLDLGIKYSKDFGCERYIGYCADTFGHSKSLPAIFQYYGFDGGIFWRGLGNLPQCFDWQGLKSVYLRQGYFHDYLNSTLSYPQKAKMIENQLLKIDDGTQEKLLLPIGADHLMSPENPKAQIKEINKYLKNYELVISNPFEYLKSVKPTKKIQGELRDNSRNFILPGILSSRIDIKQKNAYSQWTLLRIAQPLNAICYSNGLTKENYQPHIDIAKEELIKNHAHDSIYGCSIDDVHKDMLKRFSVADKTAKCVTEEILNELSTNSRNINIINLSDYKYKGVCEIKTKEKLDFGQKIATEKSIERELFLDPDKIPVTEDFKNIYTYLIKPTEIEPFLISKFEKQKIKSDLKITQKSIENSKIALKIKNGKIEITDKISKKVYQNFIEFADFADVGDSYNYAPIKNDKRIKAEIVNSKIAINGDIRVALNITCEIKIPEKSQNNARSKTLKTHKLNLTATLDTQSDFIKFDLNWVNKSENHILKAVFNMKEPITETISDDMLGEVKRKFDPDYKMPIPAPKGVELRTNTAPMQTYVKTQGVGVITKGLNEYEVRKNSLEITLLRSTGIISNPKNSSRGTPAGPPIITPDLLGLGENKAEFALTFCENIKACQQEFYGCAFAFFGEQPSQKLIKLNGELIDAKYENGLKIRTFEKNKIKDITL